MCGYFCKLEVRFAMEKSVLFANMSFNNILISSVCSSIIFKTDESSLC